MRPLLTDSRAFGVVVTVAEAEAAALAVALVEVAVVPGADSVVAEQKGFLVVAAVGRWWVAVEGEQVQAVFAGFPQDPLKCRRSLENPRQGAVELLVQQQGRSSSSLPLCHRCSPPSPLQSCRGGLPSTSPDGSEN